MHYLTNSTLTSKDINLAIKVIKSQKITKGKYTELVENAFKRKLGRYSIFVNSGSSANLLAFSLLINKYRNNKILKSGDEVLIPTLCWSTSLYPIIQCGLKPVFVDVEKDTLNISLQDLKNKITPKTRCIMLVHALGNCTDMSKLQRICKKNKLILVEDTCEALGSKFNKKYLGTFGELSTFSFYFSHHITSGEGGLITCKSYSDYKILLSLRAHGWSRDIDSIKQKRKNTFYSQFNFINIGYNLRATDIQAALLINQIPKIDSFRINRKYNFNLLRKNLIKDSFIRKNIQLPSSYKKADISWFGFPILIENNLVKYRDKIAIELTECGIETRPIISGDFTNQKIFKKYKFFNKNSLNLKNSVSIDKSGFFIGNYSYKINKITAKKIINKLLEILKKYENKNRKS